jgi:hypothetical protein
MQLHGIINFHGLRPSWRLKSDHDVMLYFYLKGRILYTTLQKMSIGGGLLKN